MKRAPDHRHVDAPVVRRRHVLGLLVSVVVAFVVAGTGSSPGATSASVVGATVPSATNLDIDGCLAGTAGVTSFGPITSASSNVTGAECVIEFGSSNDTSQLRLSQSDGFGSAMYRLSSGSPDQTFATGGVFTLAASAGEDVASDIVRQPDGKLLVAGYYDDAGTRRPLVTRLNADGTLDPSFDGDGIRHLDTQQLNAATRTYLALDASGRAVVVWGSQLPTGSIRITRLTTSGGDDATFGTAGVATHVVSGGGNGSIVADVKVDPAGRILVSGKFWPNVEWGWYGTTARFTSTGGLDTTLAGDGTVTAICPSSDHTQMTTDVVPLPDGGFISSNGHESGGHLKIIMKWTETGVLDPGFGTNGCSIPGVFRGNGLAIDPSGRILFGADGAVVRLTSAGVADPAFGASGITPFGGYARDIAVDVDGSIVVAWTSSSLRTTRLSDSGIPVTSHGTAGTAAISVGSDAGTDETDIVLLPDGGIVQVARDTSDGSAFDLVVVRRESSRTANFDAGTHDWTIGGPNGVFGACMKDATLGAVTDGATWTSNLGITCPATNGAIWRGIPAASNDPASLVARTTTPATTTATATLQFGLRTASSQPPGNYLAPVTFDVIAPGA